MIPSVLKFSTADKLAEAGAQETSTVTVETIAKISKQKGSGAVLPVFRSDVSKVQSKGMGLKKAYIGKQNQFNINTENAGGCRVFLCTRLIVVTRFSITVKSLYSKLLPIQLKITFLREEHIR